MMTGGAGINRRTGASLDVLSDMGRDANDAQVSHELPGVVTLVGSEGVLMRIIERLSHPQG